MENITRRGFLSDVGRGALIASLGPALVSDLGLARAYGDDSAHALQFGELEPLVVLMRETPLDQLMARIVKEVQQGTPAARVVAAAALANARALGGEDYVGYHSLMALSPAYAMAGRQPSGRELLPILKVLYRNTRQIQKHGGPDAMHPIDAAPETPITGIELRELVRQRDMAGSESAFARMAAANLEDAFNEMQLVTMDDINVHRVVLAWRSWDLLPLTGPEHAHTMLRQSIRHCVDAEKHRVDKGQPEPGVRKSLVQLIDKYKLLDLQAGERIAEDAWVDQLAKTIHLKSKDEAAEAVAAALAEGFSVNAVAEAISLAANRLVLCDPGRPAKWASTDTPEGSVHGASVGVHASDAAHAWRNIARVGRTKTAVLSMVVGAYHTGGQQILEVDEHPSPADRETVRDVPAERLLTEVDAAIRNKDQRRACVLVEKYGSLDQPVKPLLEILQGVAISQDGALHAEKYLQTATEEFSFLRPSLRWNEMMALARVSASEYGFAAPGMDEANRLIS